jgi:hypothetical protein
MIQTAEQITSLVDDEIGQFKIVDRDFLRPYLVPPSVHSLLWDYSRERIKYPAWLVADLRQKDIGIFYSEHGHGTTDPWGTIHMSDKRFGMDDRWFLSLEDAVINSGCWNGQLPDDYEIG